MEADDQIDHREPAQAGEEAVLLRFVAAREAGDVDGMTEATARFVQGRYLQLLRMAQLKLPNGHDAEDVVGEAIVSALTSIKRSTFAGTTPEEFGAWLHRILKRRIADHFRRREREIDAGSLDIEPDDQGKVAGRQEPVALTADPAAEIPILDAHERVVAGLSPKHAQVIELWWNARLPASEIVEKLNAADGSGVGTPMTVDNVHQIVSRYRARMRTALDLKDAGR